MYILMYTRFMARSYSVADARAHLPEIIDEVNAGGDVHLTRRGRPVAVVLSSERYEALHAQRAQFSEAYRVFLGRHPIEEIGLDPDTFDSVRDRGPGRRVRL
jgi:prevent-host-death family protein